MQSKILHAALGLVAGLIISFIFTNEVNRRETDRLRAELAQAQSASASKNSSASQDETAAPPRLTRAEVQQAVERADANAKDVYQQRNLGQALYLYAAQSNDTATLEDAARLLKRAHELDSENFDTLVLLGNALFDIGTQGDATRFIEARNFYAQALRIKPDDVNVRTDLGLTYFFGKPSDAKQAIIEYRKSLSVNPRHAKTLQNLAAAQISIKRFDEAERTLDDLTAIDNQNPSLPKLQAQLATARNAASMEVREK